MKNLSEQRNLTKHMMANLGIEPGSHWWETNAITTTPPLPSKMKNDGVNTFNKLALVWSHINNFGSNIT